MKNSLNFVSTCLKVVDTRRVGNRKKHLLHKNIRAHIKAGSAIYTDALMSYMGLKQQGFEHQVIDHAERYVDGQVHTNGLENFWSL